MFDPEKVALWAMGLCLTILTWLGRREIKRIDILEVTKANKDEVAGHFIEVRRDIREVHECLDDIKDTQSEQYSEILKLLLEIKK